MKLYFTLNNRPVLLDIDGGIRVVDLLREEFELTGTKEGCGTGECGACTIWVDNTPQLSCLMLAAQLQGRKITTIEGLNKKIALPVQEAFARHGAVQCGYCTPGMVMTAADLLTREKNLDRATIRKSLAGNLCRCTGYHKIVDAVEAAASTLQEKQ